MARPKTEAATYKSLMVRLPESVLEKFKVQAGKQRRSLNKQLLYVIEQSLEDTEETGTHDLSRAAARA